MAIESWRCHNTGLKYDGKSCYKTLIFFMALCLRAIIAATLLTLELSCLRSRLRIFQCWLSCFAFVSNCLFFWKRVDVFLSYFVFSESSRTVICVGAPQQVRFQKGTHVNLSLFWVFSTTSPLHSTSISPWIQVPASNIWNFLAVESWAPH